MLPELLHLEEAVLPDHYFFMQYLRSEVRGQVRENFRNRLVGPRLVNLLDNCVDSFEELLLVPGGLDLVLQATLMQFEHVHDDAMLMKGIGK